MRIISSSRETVINCGEVPKVGIPNDKSQCSCVFAYEPKDMFDKAETQNAPASISIIVNGQVIGDKLMTAIIECVSCPECGYEHRVSAYWVKGSERLNPDFKEA